MDAHISPKMLADVATATIAVVGLGYVGLPVATAFGAHRRVIGYDVDPRRVAMLRDGHDATGEVTQGELAAATHLAVTSDPAALSEASVIIVAVPTPVDDAKRPDLSFLETACETVGRHMPLSALVIFESTVFPGCTQGHCAPILERASGRVLNHGFFVGYSPERINPGDPTHRLRDIVKVTAGSTADAAAAVDALYTEVVSAGTHRAPSIEVAEAAKVIENTQRDINIALMNELSVIFHKLGIDTHDVLAAARTKWNFLPFHPGLVGGHCIGIDPYYLTARAQEVGHHPEIILAGRRINDRMGSVVVERVMRLMMARRIPVVDSRVLVLGVGFKENCPDIRNSQVFSIVAEFQDLNAFVDAYDPLADNDETRCSTGVAMLEQAPVPGSYDAVILAVAHREFVLMGAAAIAGLAKPGGVFFDVKGAFDKSASDGRL